MMWIEEVAIGDTAVSGRGCKRGAAQHQLVDHELAVVFAERALDCPVAGVGRIGAAGPLPDDAEGIIELAASRRHFPLHFGRLVLAAPASESVRLVVAD